MCVVQLFQAPIPLKGGKIVIMLIYVNVVIAIFEITFRSVFACSIYEGLATSDFFFLDFHRVQHLVVSPSYFSREVDLSIASVTDHRNEIEV